MKKLLTTIALALGTLALATATTHAVHFHPSTEANFTDCALLKHYRSYEKAIPGSYIEVNCDFGYVNNEVTVISDHQEFTTDKTGLTGKYSIGLKDVVLPQKNICYIYQKISGGHSPNWEVPYPMAPDWRVDEDLPDMTDHDLHASGLQNYFQTKLIYTAKFGGWSTGDDERIAIYAAIND